MSRTCWCASPCRAARPAAPGCYGGGALRGYRGPALRGQLGFVGGVDLLHGARPVGEVGLVEQPGQVGDGVAGVGEQAPSAGGVVIQQTVQIRTVQLWAAGRASRAAHGGGGLVPRPRWGIGVLAPPGASAH